MDGNLSPSVFDSDLNTDYELGPTVGSLLQRGEMDDSLHLPTYNTDSMFTFGSAAASNNSSNDVLPVSFYEDSRHVAKMSRSSFSRQPASAPKPILPMPTVFAPVEAAYLMHYASQMRQPELSHALSQQPNNSFPYRRSSTDSEQRTSEEDGTLSYDDSGDSDSERVLSRTDSFMSMSSLASSSIDSLTDTNGTLGAHACNHCSKSFSKQNSLKAHLRTHESNKSFGCTMCQASFRRCHDLKRHIRSLHTHIRPFECPLCDKKFSRMDALKRHVSRKTCLDAKPLNASSSSASAAAASRNYQSYSHNHNNHHSTSSDHNREMETMESHLANMEHMSNMSMNVANPFLLQQDMNVNMNFYLS